MCICQPLVYDAKSLSGDFYYEKKKLNNEFALNFVSNGITATESLKMLQKCFGESSLSRTQVFEWHKAFSEGREVIENLPHASCPSTSVSDDKIEKVMEIVLENRRVGITEATEVLEISYGSTQHIVVHVWGMKCVPARLVPEFFAKRTSCRGRKKMSQNRKNHVKVGQKSR